MDSRAMFSALTLLLVVAYAASSNPSSPFVDNLHESELKRLFGVEDLNDAPVYEIVYPKYMADDETHSICTEAIAEDSLNINIEAFGENLKLVVHQDDSLFSDDFYAEEIQGNGEPPVPLSVRLDCLYAGKVESEPDSMVSLSTSSGLNAIVYHANGPTFIEPMGHDASDSRGRPHVAYKRRAGRTFNCGTSAEFSQEVRSQFEWNVDTQAAGQKTVELGVFVTDDVYKQRGEGTEAAALTVIQGIKVLLEKPSLGTLKFKCVSLHIFKGDGPTFTKTAFESPGIGGKDQLSRNVESDADPKHWDNALYLIGIKMYDSRERLIQGIAHFSEGGYVQKAVAITTWEDAGAAEISAHELGHNLGMYHDGDGNDCPRSGFIMTSGGDLGATEWSTCSKADFDIRMGQTTVYDD